MGDPGIDKPAPHYKRLFRDGRNKDVVLWVHGWNGNSRSTWRTLAPYTHFLLGDEFDFHSFHYPAGLLHKASYHSAAKSLEDYIGNHLSGYEHVHVVAHSTGGLVIRQVILKTLQKKGEDTPPAVALKNFASIINIGVPHHGISATTTIGATLAPFLYLGFCGLLALGLHRLIPQLQHFTHVDVSASWQALLLTREAWASALIVAIFFLPVLFWVTRLAQIIFDAILKRRIYRPIIGLNRIAWELAWPRRWLKKQDRRALKKMNAAGVINHDLVGELDQVVRQIHQGAQAPHWHLKPSDVRTRIRWLPFGHVKSLQVTCEEEPIVTTISDNILNARLLRDTILPLCQTTQAVIANLNHLLKTPALLDDGVIMAPAYAYDSRRTFPAAWLGDQQKVADELLRRLLTPATTPQRPIIVTGAAGIGKSAVLRHLADRLALNRQQQLAATSQPTPIWVPLYRFDIRQAYAKKWKDTPAPASQGPHDRQDYQKLLLDCILEFFLFGSQIASKGHNISNHTNISHASIRGALAEGAVVILDGVDDWLSLLAGLKPSTTITDLLAALRHEFPQSRVVLGVRESRMTVCGSLEGMDVIEVASLSQAAIIRHLHTALPAGPARAGMVTHIQQNWDDPTVRLFCSPLIFMTILANLGLVQTGWLRSRGLIFENTLHHILSNSAAFSQLGITIAEALDTLMLVGHVMYTRRIASAPLSTLIPHIQSVLTSIESEMGQIDEVPVPATAAAALAMNQGTPETHLPKNPLAPQLARNLSTTLTRTLPILGPLLTTSSVFIFVQNEWRPEHREWNEFLAARFLAYATCMELTGELSHRGSQTRHFFLAADILAHRFPTHTLRPAWVQRIFDHATQKGLIGQEEALKKLPSSTPPPPHSNGNPLAQIAIGNMLGLIGHCQNPLHPIAADELLVRSLRHSEKAVTPSTPLVELVALQNLGFRALHFDAGLRLKLYQWLKDCYPDAFPIRPASWWRRFLLYLADHRPYRKIRNLHAVICANLLEKDLGQRLGHTAPDIYLDSWQLTRVLEDSVTHIDDRLHPDPVKRTMQEVFASLMSEAQVNPAKTISCVTYGLCIVKAYLDGALDDNSSTVRSVLHYYQKNPKNAPSAKNLRDQIVKYQNLPELLHIWDQCVVLVEARKRRYPLQKLLSGK